MDKKTVTIDTESLAHLSRLYLSKEELSSFGEDMEDMVAFVSELSAYCAEGEGEVCTEGEVCRPDRCCTEYSKNELLSVAPETCDGFFAVPKVVD